MLERRAALDARGADRTVSVQVMGDVLVDSGLNLDCTGVGWSTQRGIVRNLYVRSFEDLRDGERLLCLGGVFRVESLKFAQPRTYAGTFVGSRPTRSASGRHPKEARRREGSPLIFETTRSRYVAGVLAAEEPDVTPRSRPALIEAIDGNVRDTWAHEGRPICDESHCQRFVGTEEPDAKLREQLAASPTPNARRWTLFHPAREVPWTLQRAVPGSLGRGARAPRWSDGELSWLHQRTVGEEAWEEFRKSSCDDVRQTFRLPGCPSSVREVTPGLWEFRGDRRGHARGLSVTTR
ncbi:MAG: hypothetical protein HC923_13330 [Myxococcales bacterium]|nr:hypothetical protein [Myxococcales bacterium]